MLVVGSEVRLVSIGWLWFVLGTLPSSIITALRLLLAATSVGRAVGWWVLWWTLVYNHKVVRSQHLHKIHEIWVIHILRIHCFLRISRGWWAFVVWLLLLFISSLLHWEVSLLLLLWWLLLWWLLLWWLLLLFSEELLLLLSLSIITAIRLLQYLWGILYHEIVIIYSCMLVIVIFHLNLRYALE